MSPEALKPWKLYTQKPNRNYPASPIYTSISHEIQLIMYTTDPKKQTKFYALETGTNRFHTSGYKQGFIIYLLSLFLQ